MFIFQFVTRVLQLVNTKLLKYSSQLNGFHKMADTLQPKQSLKDVKRMN
jgi:hypothetical protein